MTGILSEIYLYRGSEVTDNYANILIEIYHEKRLLLINVENDIPNRDH